MGATALSMLQLLVAVPSPCDARQPSDPGAEEQEAGGFGRGTRRSTRHTARLGRGGIVVAAPADQNDARWRVQEDIPGLGRVDERGPGAADDEDGGMLMA